MLFNIQTATLLTLNLVTITLSTVANPVEEATPALAQTAILEKRQSSPRRRLGPGRIVMNPVKSQSQSTKAAKVAVNAIRKAVGKTFSTSLTTP
jgi:hypothetical protein